MVKNGIRDKHPQYLRDYVTESAANTYTEKEIATPVPVALPNGKYLVMNLLRIFVSLQLGACDTNDSVSFHLADRSQTAIKDWDTTGIVCACSHQEEGAVAAGLVQMLTPIKIELSDGQGNGVLFAKSKIYAAVKSLSQAAVMTARFAIEYTLVEIDAEEYIGIVEGA